MLTPFKLDGDPGAATLLFDSRDSLTARLSSKCIPKYRTVPVGVLNGIVTVKENASINALAPGPHVQFKSCVSEVLIKSFVDM